MSQEHDEYFAEVEKKHAGNEFITVHCHRYAISMDWIAGEMPLVKRVLEIGAPCPFTAGLKHFFPHLEIENTHPADLRTVFTAKKNVYDFILNMEVIEHINDPSVEDKLHIESFVGDGVRIFVDTCFSALKPGGKMFVTTPNLSSYGALWRTMLGWSPFSYNLHVRELSINELWHRMAQSGFAVVSYETKDCYKEDVPIWMLPKMQAFLAEADCQIEKRRQVQFAMALKPVNGAGG